jgi:hypothetical protein
LDSKEADYMIEICSRWVGKIFDNRKTIRKEIKIGRRLKDVIQEALKLVEESKMEAFAWKQL